jgi:hypothetical protein
MDAETMTAQAREAAKAAGIVKGSFVKLGRKWGRVVNVRDHALGRLATIKRLDAEGSEWSQEKAGVETVEVMISRVSELRLAVMNLKYGELEVV